MVEVEEVEVELVLPPDSDVVEVKLEFAVDPASGVVDVGGGGGGPK